MSWKDWLYIPKSDKIAIVSMLGVIAILIILYTGILFFKKGKENNFKSPDDYLQWQAKIVEKKKIEKIYNFEKQKQYSYVYQSKMAIGETVELNSADTTQLKTIPGIGSGYANRIIKYRTSLGGFARIEQLNEVWGLDTYLYSQITPYITLVPEHDSIYINRDDFKELLGHPYLNYKQVVAIVDIRERKGSIKSIKRLKLLEEFKRRDIEQLSLYTSFK